MLRTFPKNVSLNANKLSINCKLFASTMIAKSTQTIRRISVDKVKPKVNQLLCCLPEVCAPDLDYDNLFRIIIMNFMDAYDFDVRAVKKSCVHIVNKDLKLIPFETMNLFYRDDKIKRLEELKLSDAIRF